MSLLRRVLAIVVLMIGVCALPGWAIADPAASDEGAGLRKVRVQLKWLHQFQFAGFYAAIDQGYFRRAGLEVELLEGGPEIDPVQSVTSGRAEFGVGNSSLLLDFNQGHPVVAVAAIFQHSPFVIMARNDPALRSIKDLEGKTVMTETHSAELTAYMKKAGVDLSKVRLVPHDGTVTSLMRSGKESVSAITAYISTEPFEATRLGLDYKLFNPRDLKIDFYGDTLFTHAQFAQSHPETVAAMREALIQGWHYAQTHQAEVVDLILRSYRPRMDRPTLTLEAQAIYNLLQSDVVDIGYMSEARWRAIGTVFAEAGMLPAHFKLDGFFITPEAALPAWARQTFWLGGAVLILGGGLTAYILSLNRRLQASLKLQSSQTCELERVNLQLSQLSRTDPLTGLFNRRHFDEALAEEWARAERHGGGLSMLMIDVDHFKSYNDQLGHPAGDACLQRVADALQCHVRRAGEFVARIGGEEFAVVTTSSSLDEVRALAERLRQSVMALDLPHGGNAPGVVTISIGTCTQGSRGGAVRSADLVAQADAALYEAKQTGRNRVVSRVLTGSSSSDTSAPSMSASHRV